MSMYLQFYSVSVYCSVLPLHFFICPITDVRHWRCLTRKPLILRLHTHGAVLPPAEKPTSHPCAARGTVPMTCLSNLLFKFLFIHITFSILKCLSGIAIRIIYSLVFIYPRNYILSVLSKYLFRQTHAKLDLRESLCSGSGFTGLFLGL